MLNDNSLAYLQIFIQGFVYNVQQFFDIYYIKILIKKKGNSRQHKIMQDQSIQYKINLLTQTQEPICEDILQYQSNIKRQNKFDALDANKIFGYGIGHFVNDLVAACWFNYMFFYLKNIVKTSAAPTALLVGQISDGIATPIVGYFSDRTKTKYGQRTPWYIFGLVLVLSCFIPLFQKFTSQNKNIQQAYYMIFPALFNIGWAALQISHMSLVPALTCSRKRRDRLNNLRNSFTFIANFIVLGMGVFIFKLMNNPPLQYAIISYIVVFFGICSSIYFLYNVNQVQLIAACQKKAQKLKKYIQKQKKYNTKHSNNTTQQFPQNDNTVQENNKIYKVYQQQLYIEKQQSIKDWFKIPKFYFFGICYMGVRLYTNLFGTLLPFYLVGVLRLGTDKDIDKSVPVTVALVPLIVYLFSVLASTKLTEFYMYFGRKTALVTGTVIGVLSLGTMFFLRPNTGWIMYFIAPFIGVSQTMVLSTGINLISDVVGTKAKTGAFVFGIYSLLDKFSTGLAIYFIGTTVAYQQQDLHKLTCPQIKQIRYTMVLIPAFAAILATLIVITYPIQQYSIQDNKYKTYDQKLQKKNNIQEQLVM